jgi:hypothetical protein
MKKKHCPNDVLISVLNFKNEFDKRKIVFVEMEMWNMHQSVALVEANSVVTCNMIK